MVYRIFGFHSLGVYVREVARAPSRWRRAFTRRTSDEMERENFEESTAEMKRDLVSAFVGYDCVAASCSCRCRLWANSVRGPPKRCTLHR